MNSSVLMQSSGLGQPQRPAAAAKLQLTSLVDMMVILVVFLLVSFSVEGQLITPADGLDLPVSSADDRVRAGVAIEIGTDAIKVAGQMSVATSALAREEAAATADLDAALENLTVDGVSPTITIHCDRRVDFRVLGGVLRACGRQGLADVSLLVLEDGS